jgi:hypothetical protein
LCGSDYAKKWKDWAKKAKLIKDENAAMAFSERVKLAMKVFFIFYLNIILVLSIWQYSKEPTGIKPEDISGFDRLYMKLLFGFFLTGILYNSLSFYLVPSFKKKIENHVERLFPHSNNEEYAAFNSIQT